jgi:hypothetical protein
VREREKRYVFSEIISCMVWFKREFTGNLVARSAYRDEAVFHSPWRNWPSGDPW